MTDGSIKVSTDVIDPQGSDYASTINKVKAAAPDAIFYGGYYAQAGRLLKQLRDGGEGSSYPVTAHWTPALAKGAGGSNADGAIVSCPCLIDPTVKVGEQES